MIFPANLLTGAKHPAFSTNHMADIDVSLDVTKHNYNQLHKTQTTTQENQHAINVETRAWFRGLRHHPDRNCRTGVPM